VTKLAARPVPPPTLGRLLDFVRAHPVPAAGLALGVLYAVLRIPLMLFYAEFDVTPEEVGFGNVNLIRQSVFVLALILGVFAVYVVAGWLWFIPFKRLTDIADRCHLLGRKRENNLLYLTAALPFATFLLGAMIIAAAPLLGMILLGFTLLWLSLAPRLIPHLPTLRDVGMATAEASRRSDHGLTARILTGLFACVVLLALLAYVPVGAALNARDVRDGGVASGKMFPWRAVPVRLSWEKTRRSPPPFANDCRTLRYLGEADSHIVVFDSRLDRTFRIPDAAVSAQIEPHCTG
jgi:hypothetical protein